jgi:hypothetical protein
MAGLLVLGALGFAAFLVLSLVWAALSMVFWVVLLPFKLLGLVFRGMAALLLLPLLLVFALVGCLIFGAGMLVFLIPAFPVVLLVLFAVWLVRGRGVPRPHTP